MEQASIAYYYLLMCRSQLPHYLFFVGLSHFSNSVSAFLSSAPLSLAVMPALTQ